MEMSIDAAAVTLNTRSGKSVIAADLVIRDVNDDLHYAIPLLLPKKRSSSTWLRVSSNAANSLTKSINPPLIVKG